MLHLRTPSGPQKARFPTSPTQKNGIIGLPVSITKPNEARTCCFLAESKAKCLLHGAMPGTSGRIMGPSLGTSRKVAFFSRINNNPAGPRGGGILDFDHI